MREKKKKIINDKNTIIATGSKQKSLPGFVFDEKKIISSTEALTITTVPKNNSDRSRSNCNRTRICLQKNGN